MKIFYVEDEPFLSKIVKESLETRGFQVQLVEDGAQVLAQLAHATPDICVLDVMLPNVDGFSLAKTIKAQYPRLPIIFLTAKSQTQDVLEGFEAGGSDYLKKPFSMEELIVRIKNLVHLHGSRAPAAGPALGQYRFDPVKQTLHWNGQTRNLSFRESQLLAIFVQKPNQTIPRKEILDAVWGHDSIFNSRNLDVYITRLRDYLRDDPNIQILTLKGVGYRFLNIEQ